jgi:NAD+ synthase (glutamine-hydrolysing)
MKVMVAQMNPKIGDLDENTRRIIAWMKKARKQEVDVILFPELSLTGYLPEDLLLHNAFIDSTQQHLERMILASKGIMAFVGTPRRNVHQGEKPLLNSCAVLYDGHLIGFQDKWLLPTYDVFEERRYFEPGHHTRTWDYKGKKIGLVICEDIWQHAGYVGYSKYPRDPIAEMVAREPDVLLNMSASPFQLDKPDVRVKVCGKAARTLDCPVIMCCQVGANDQLIFDGYSVYVNEKGELVDIAKGFEEDEMICDLDLKKEPIDLEYDSWEGLYEGLSLGVRDYFGKQGFEKACLGISGGIDSAVVACIAVNALGAENVLGVAMPSQYTSDASTEDAIELCKNLGIELLHINIEGPVEAFEEALSPVFKGLEPDVTEENLQARSRGSLLMAISNKLGHVVLSTGNKSEMAVGYCTLYGDMCGGIGVIGDVIKTHVYELARWINANNDQEVIPDRTITKAPSAELRPDQRDSDSLPDYEIVDQVLTGYVENYMTASEISIKNQIPLEIALNLIRRIHYAEYKRRQGPPVLRVSRKSFGVGRRYPIVQGWS